MAAGGLDPSPGSKFSNLNRTFRLAEPPFQPTLRVGKLSLFPGQKVYVSPLTSEIGQLIQQRMIEVDNALFKALTPTVAVGEVIKVVVRQNGENGQGMVGFRGQAIRASLPPNLQSGDEILAKVSKGEQDQVILKILNLQKGGETAQPQGPTGVAAKLAGELKSLVDKPEGFLNFKAQTPAPGTAETEGQVPAQSNELARSLKTVASGSDLKNPQTALTQLMAATTGEVAESLRDAAAAIRSLVEKTAADAPDKLLANLKSGLADLLSSVRDQNSGSDPQTRLVNILKTVRDELKSNDNLTPQARAVLEKVERALSEPAANKQTLESKLENAQKTIDLHLRSDRSPARAGEREAANPAELSRLAQRLEQLASTQETLQQLNPLMQALGEPALVLLPFLSHGLLNHSEVTIDPNARRKNQGGGGREGADEEDRGDSTPYQRIQVSVPMPNLGPIDVDIAHRRDELLVRITVQDDEAEKFISSQIENLTETLRSLGFNRPEIVAAVGEPAENIPVWCEGLASKMSIRA